MKNYLFIILITVLFFSCNTENKTIISQEKFNLKLNRIIKCPKENGIPIDIEFNNNSEFVLDWGNKSVFKTTVGQANYIIDENKELTHPGALAFIGENLIVSDRFNREINFYSSSGGFITDITFDKYRLDNLSIYKNNLIMRTRNYEVKKDDVLARVVNLNGKNINDIGKIFPIDGMLTDKVLMNEVEIASNNSLLVAGNKYHKPIIRIFNINDKTVKHKCEYELKYNVEDFLERKEDEHYSDYSILQSLDLDEKYIYAVVKRRKLTQRESKVGHFISDVNGVYLLENKVRSTETDLNELLVFTVEGELIKRINLNVFCNKIKVHNNKLYVIDSFVGKQIYEYSILNI